MRLIKIKLFTVFLLVPLVATGFKMVEDGDEMVKVNIQFSSETSGIIEAYRCNNCPPKTYIFDKKLVVFPHNGRSFVERLKALDGEPVVLTWKVNTVKALRIWPIFK